MFMDDFLVKSKIVFDRGKQWIGYFTFLMMVFVTVTSMKEYAYFQFLRSRYWMVFALLASFILVLFIGYLEIRRLNVYQKEVEIYARMNPVQRRVFENHERIIERLDSIEEKLG